ncbi:MAG: hypothetical protein U0822_26830 [Anaerolineae bacterium]
MTRDAMLEAHVQYELKRLGRRNVKRTIREEVVAALEWLAEVKVNDIANAAQVMKSIQRNVIDRPLPDDFVDYIEDNARLVYQFLREDATRTEEVVPRYVFDRVVEILIGLKTLRLHITHQVVSNSVYSMLISDVLYHGIKDFVLTENMLAKNIPGASSLVKLGRKSLNVAAPRLETGIDKQLVKFINANIQDTIAQSETFLDNTLDPPTMRKLGDEIWNANAPKTMAEIAGDFDVEAVEAAIEAARLFWLHYRQTDLFYAIVAEVVDRFFERYGESDIRSLLEEMGITQDVVLEEAYAFAIPVIEHGLASGYLERRLRKRLGAFYSQYEDEVAEG